MTFRRVSVWSAAVVNSPEREASASGGSDTQQNQATSGWRASGVSMLTRPPAAGRATQRPLRQMKSLGPRLAMIATRGERLFMASHQGHARRATGAQPRAIAPIMADAHRWRGPLDHLS